MGQRSALTLIDGDVEDVEDRALDAHQHPERRSPALDDLNRISCPGGRTTEPNPSRDRVPLIVKLHRPDAEPEVPADLALL